MREENGFKHIEEAVKKLEKTHAEDIKVYDLSGGMENRKRLTGKNETSNLDKFTWGVANRNGSVRIPRSVAMEKRGYFEDRRPAGNADPYQIINALVRSCLISK
ncbi:hypothetical protein NQ317_004968 [Molorchus minor]|uniref:glutamine synthetase n=1 Tax=Molorchus minor TaxID=1323400 RepID=A0ABQ9K3Y4_9CUCU|nr:hypothetical protein NQ317_004968 [Molorchus minor]